MRRAVITISVLALALPGAASARHRPKYLAPPGNSAVSQYLEVVPTTGGSRPTSPPPGPGGEPPASNGGLQPGQQQSLDRLGPDGRTLAAVVAATVPEPIHPSTVRTGPDRHAGAGRPGRQAPGDPLALQPGGARSTLASLVDAVGGGNGGGLGPLLPALMLTAAVVVLLRAAFRRRGPRTP